jgi:hypothetical protein
MATSWWNRLFKPKSCPAARRRRPAVVRPRIEELEARLQPAAFVFSTGAPDGLIATISEPPNAHNHKVEFETADDFVLGTETVINHASFTGLLTGGATLKNVDDVFLTVYRVFNNDSDLNRTIQVPSRINSPADNEIDNFDSAVGDLSYHALLLNPTFTAQSSVFSTDKISVGSGGNGQVTGQEARFDVTFKTTLDLPAGHYFFVSKVGLKASAPADAHFLDLSAPKPIAPPGTPFPAGAKDLQSWMRFDPGNGTGLAPDWLRIGQDIIGGTAFPTFNASFSLSGHTVPPRISSLSQASVAEGSPDLSLTITGSDFTSQSIVQIGNQALTTRFASSSELQVIIPAAFLGKEGHFNLSVIDGAGGLSNSARFTVTESVPALTASADQGRIFQQITLNGLVSDQAVEDHRLRINWGDGTVQVIDLGVQASPPFSETHTFAASRHIHHDTIVVTALDDEGVAGNALVFDVIV